MTDVLLSLVLSHHPAVLICIQVEKEFIASEKEFEGDKKGEEYGFLVFVFQNPRPLGEKKGLKPKKRKKIL